MARWGNPAPAAPYPAYHHTWLTLILPQMEQGPLYQSVDFRRAAFNNGAGQPQAIVRTVVPTLWCPSDVGPRDPSSTQGMAVTTYGASEGWHWWQGQDGAGLNAACNSWGLPSNIHNGDLKGVFTPPDCGMAPAISQGIKDVTDGTSNTIFVAECNSLGYTGGSICGPGSNRGRMRNPGGENVFRAAFCFNSTNGYPSSECGICSWPDDSGTAAGWFKEWPYAFGPRYICAYGINSEWPGAGSNHPGIEQCLKVDGSVQGLGTTVEYWIWCSLNGIHDGQTLPGGY
jgi:hypothetical protein